MATKITRDILESHLHCKLKGHLKLIGQQGSKCDYETLLTERRAEVRLAAIDKILARHAGEEIPRNIPLTTSALNEGAPFILNPILEDDLFSLSFDGLKKVDGPSKLGDFHYIPILFSEGEKVRKEQRLLLELYGLLLARLQGQMPTHGIIWQGPDGKTSKVRLNADLRKTERLLRDMKEIYGAESPPKLILNDHCQICEFRQRCHEQALKEDNISLMRGMSEAEVEKQRSRGISTVTQLSHTYRPGRRGKRRTGKARKHDHALQALALRDKKVYVLDSPTIPKSNVALYLDVEGIPDQDFYYLIGLLVVRDGHSEMFSFWANDERQQKSMWESCVNEITKHEEFTLYHYGSYETRFLDRMRLMATGDEVTVVDRIKSRSFNILSAIYSHIYFPTVSNGLKNIGGYLGSKWSDNNASGIQSVAWRGGWESEREESLKQKLIQYNHEDCSALQCVSEFLMTVCEGQPGTATDGRPIVCPVTDLQAQGFRFGKTEFFCPDLEHINRCAYSDYQRDKVYLRTSPAMRQSLRRKKRASRLRPKTNERVECEKPDHCPACGSTKVHTFCSQRSYKSVYDLKFSRSGVKRWIVKYSSLRYRCWECRITFNADEYRTNYLFGPNLSCWAIYQHIALRQSYEDLATSLNDIFGFSFGYSILKHVKPRMAEKYRVTYDKLKQKLKQGQLIHGDETKVKLKSESGYVWAVTNMEEVVYAYTSTREGTILDDLLNGFQGVLVSDFYAAYDSPKCQQQKCFIHLIRDINDDIFHNPFDDELKQLALKLVALLRPIIDTIDRFGLKRHYLNKHKEDVEGYFKYLLTQEFRSELAGKYQKRMLKYKDKLFVFLDHDGVPWNNNNAENAIKFFASRRKLMGASYTKNTIHDHLIFLSILQTCKRKNLNFLRFLRSGLLDLDEFAESLGR
jgi:predicted RecB family nuclease